MPFAPSAQLHPVGLDLPSLDDDADSADDSDLDVRLSSRIRSTARAQAAHTSAGFTASHLEAAYESEDEDPDSVARRKRRLGHSYITSESRARGEALRERRNRLAEMLAAEEDACAHQNEGDADDDDDNDGMDVDGNGGDGGGSSRRNRQRSHPPLATRPARKRRFFRESRYDLATLLKPPASARPAAAGSNGLVGLQHAYGFGLGGGGGGGYAESDVASISQFGGGGAGNGITREWTEGLQA